MHPRHPHGHRHRTDGWFAATDDAEPARLGRRLFLTRLGATLGFVLVGASAACSSNGGSSGAAGEEAGRASGSATAAPPATGGEAAATTAGTDSENGTGTTSDAADLGTSTAELRWDRVDLGFVSAYVLLRGREAAVVDTGTEGNAERIDEVLRAAGSGWDQVRHVILTHHHPDHVGSLAEILGAASGATAYAGGADIAQIRSPQPLRAVADGDEVFGLEIIATPGHTPGHISVLDPAGAVLVAGDALNGAAGGGIAGPNPQFTADTDAAVASVKRLVGRRFDTAVFGHGDPVEGGADAAVERLAATL